MSKQERKHLTRLALILAIILLIVAFMGLQYQARQDAQVFERMLDNRPPVATQSE